MNTKGKNNLVIWVVVAAVVIALFVMYSGNEKTVIEHKTPADISKSESGTGLDLKFFDKDGNEIQIPSWFATNAATDVGGFTIVRRPTAPTCTAVSQCTGYLTNPYIMCWTGKCVLGNVAAITAGVSVTNPAGSQVAFLNVAPTLVTPAAFNTALTKTPTATLSPGQTASWTSTAISLGAYEGTQQTFNVTIQGTNQYTSGTVKASDALVLAFDADPTGAFTVSVQSPI